MKLPLTLGDNAIHHTHGETEEDEIVQMIDLQTNSVQLTNSDIKISHANLNYRGLYQYHTGYQSILEYYIFNCGCSFYSILSFRLPLHGHKVNL